MLRFTEEREDSIIEANRYNMNKEKESLESSARNSQHWIEKKSLSREMTRDREMARKRTEEAEEK